MQRFLKSVHFAISGWRHFFGREKNGQIQAIIALVVVLSGWYLKLTAIEWAITSLCIALVISLEMMNSSLEKLVDHLHPDHHVHIKWVKDMAAGAVLWSAVISAIIGGIIFIPKIITSF